MTQANTYEATRVRDRRLPLTARESRHRRSRHPVATDKVTVVVRTFLGLVFVVSGLNGFMNFLPQFAVTGEGASFLQTLVNSYLWPLLKVVELVVGAALLFNVYAQFAVFLLAPLTLGILWFHTTLSPPGAWLAWTIFAAEVALVVIFRNRIKQVFTRSNKVDDGKVIQDDNLGRG